MGFIVSEFYNVVQRLGEDSRIILNSLFDDMPTVEEAVKMSITNATSAAYSLVDREFLYKGNFTLPDGVHLDDLGGKYFTRDMFPGRTYMILSAIPDPTNEKLGYMYAVQCNQKVSMCDKILEKDQWGNTRPVYPISETKRDIPCYFYAALRSYKQQNDGKLDQAMYTLIVPAECRLYPMQKIVRKEFTENGYQNVYYLVNSIEMALVSGDDNDGFTGVQSVQLTKDIDGGYNGEQETTL